MLGYNFTVSFSAVSSVGFCLFHVDYLDQLGVIAAYLWSDQHAEAYLFVLLHSLVR